MLMSVQNNMSCSSLGMFSSGKTAVLLDFVQIRPFLTKKTGQYETSFANRIGSQDNIFADQSYFSDGPACLKRTVEKDNVFAIDPDQTDGPTFANDSDHQSQSQTRK